MFRMKHYSVRVVVALITILGGVAIISLVLVHVSPKFEIAPATITLPRIRSKSEEMLRVLIPNGEWGDASQLHRFERSEEIQVLTEAKVDARDDNAIAIAYLLATLGHDYEMNKGILLDALNQCASKNYQEAANCNDVMAEYLRALDWRVDASLFDSLFNVSDKADGAFEQSLGTFYSEMLWRRPRQFVIALSSRSKDEQRNFCAWAESADGGGIEDGMLSDIRNSLNRIASQSNSTLAPVARNCLLGLAASRKHTVRNNTSVK